MFYLKHIFVCTNKKENNKKCCDNTAIAAYLKKKLQDLGQFGPGKYRVSSSGCLGRCEKGPCVLVYPENLWYRIANFEDADEFVHQHLQMGQPLKNLQILEEI